MAFSSEVPGLAGSSGTMPQEARRRHSAESVVRGEALELQEIQTHEDNELNHSTPSASSGDEYRIVMRRTTSRTLSARADACRRQSRKGVWGKFTRFWTHHVTLTVPHKSNRDYFGGFCLSHLFICPCLLLRSFGEDVSRLYTHFGCHHPARSTDRTAVSSQISGGAGG